MSKMLKSTAAMACATLISRVLGLAREMAYAAFMGNGAVASAFLLAYQIPNLFRRLLGEGALTAAFIPMFKEQERTAGEEAMWRSANAVLSGLIAVGAGIVALAIVMISLALGLMDLAAQTRLMLELLRVMFPYMLFVCVAAIFMGMLNARGRFFIPALGAAFLNVILIASVLWLAPAIGGGLERQIFGVAVGVLAAGVAQALFQAPALLRDGWRFRWTTPWKEPVVGEVVRRMIPTTVGAAAFQLNILITQGFAFFLGESIVASFQYAVRLMELPQGLFGVSLAAYLLPTLSGLAADKRYPEFRGTLVNGLALLAVVNLLAGALLMGLATPIVRLLFERGAFHEEATRRVAFALCLLGPGLVAYSATGIFARAFYALGDTRTPMQISVFCLGANTILSVLFALPLREGGLALANTVTSMIHVALLGFALRKKMPRVEYARLWREGRWMAGAAALAGTAAWALSAAWQRQWGIDGGVNRAGAVFVPAILGTAVYGCALWGAGLPAARELAQYARRRTRSRRGSGSDESDVAQGS